MPGYVLEHTQTILGSQSKSALSHFLTELGCSGYI